MRSWKNYRHWQSLYGAYEGDSLSCHVRTSLGKSLRGYMGPSIPVERATFTVTKRVKNLRKKRFCWAHCVGSIMKHAWTDTKYKSIMTLCVHYGEGTSFTFVAYSGEAHSIPYMFNCVDTCVKKVGNENVCEHFYSKPLLQANQKGS